MEHNHYVTSNPCIERRRRILYRSSDRRIGNELFRACYFGWGVSAHDLPPCAWPYSWKAPKRLKPWIGKELHLIHEYVKRGGKVKILRSEFCASAIKHYALEGNETAEYSLDKFTETGIRIWIQDITGWQPQETKALAGWKIARLEGKAVRRNLTDAIKAYIDRHPELSENNRKWLYVNASQRVDLVVFGRKAKKLATDLGVDPNSLRDALTPKELLLLQEVEDTAVRLIDLRDVHPEEAVNQMSERLLIQVQTRALSGRSE